MVYAVSVFKSYHAFENLANWGILSSKPNYCTGTNTLLIVFLLHLRQNVAITKDQIATKAVLRQKIWVRTSILYNWEDFFDLTKALLCHFYFMRVDFYGKGTILKFLLPKMDRTARIWNKNSWSKNWKFLKKHTKPVICIFKHRKKNLRFWKKLQKWVYLHLPQSLTHSWEWGFG